MGNYEIVAERDQPPDVSAAAQSLFILIEAVNQGTLEIVDCPDALTTAAIIMDIDRERVEVAERELIDKGCIVWREEPAAIKVEPESVFVDCSECGQKSPLLQVIRNHGRCSSCGEFIDQVGNQ